MYYHGINESNYVSLIFPLFLLVGLSSGIYHGFYNQQIYHARESSKLNIHERIHTLWIHVVCSLVGSTSLYTLAYKYLLSNRIPNFGSGDSVILLIGLLGLVGLGPMTLWFLVQTIIYSKNKIAEIIGFTKSI